MVELQMREAVAEHWKIFHKDKPSANQDIMAICMLEAELAKTRKSVNLFQARSAQLAQPTYSTPDKRTDQEQVHHNPEPTAEGKIEEIARTVENVEESETPEKEHFGYVDGQQSRNPSHSDVGSVHSCGPSPLEACQEPLIAVKPLGTVDHSPPSFEPRTSHSHQLPLGSSPNHTVLRESRNPSHSDVGSVHSCVPLPLEACQEPLIVRATSWHRRSLPALF
ncbi:hypothetical protein F511_10386 [Dorcoceras hygrometricum]|uniref:Uncharacterized protein n=1 Tax=Dorcoceras hygrometricum TaxID=472368 RepID=A0A2Z7CEH9_9LAMI|nr:hypothetical protein F511_10386 [Dorcoceras hygrometricum]